eukprot:CAMPEP_0172906800 /NCGR_PEP_ID=MMETSP1075-20121228/177610_1 /TAXON_ID=2916 /ORGANISM="Ceratium fusus, Strain PA161109" /LENGTH=259 /DNA_ID=CAMNT_0013764289 /DNA_START=138 /DNA_END=918 /DNA_ORIENTATION=-
MVIAKKRASESAAALQVSTASLRSFTPPRLHSAELSAIRNRAHCVTVWAPASSCAASRLRNNSIAKFGSEVVVAAAAAARAASRIQWPPVSPAASASRSRAIVSSHATPPTVTALELLWESCCALAQDRNRASTCNKGATSVAESGPHGEQTRAPSASAGSAATTARACPSPHRGQVKIRAVSSGSEQRSQEQWKAFVVARMSRRSSVGMHSSFGPRYGMVISSPSAIDPRACSIKLFASSWCHAAFGAHECDNMEEAK